MTACKDFSKRHFRESSLFCGKFQGIRLASELSLLRTEMEGRAIKGFDVVRVYMGFPRKVEKSIYRAFMKRKPEKAGSHALSLKGKKSTSDLFHVP